MIIMQMFKAFLRDKNTVKTKGGIHKRKTYNIPNFKVKKITNIVNLNNNIVYCSKTRNIIDSIL